MVTQMLLCDPTSGPCPKRKRVPFSQFSSPPPNHLPTPSNHTPQHPSHQPYLDYPWGQSDPHESWDPGGEGLPGLAWPGPFLLSGHISPSKGQAEHEGIAYGRSHLPHRGTAIALPRGDVTPHPVGHQDRQAAAPLSDHIAPHAEGRRARVDGVGKRVSEGDARLTGERNEKATI